MDQKLLMRFLFSTSQRGFHIYSTSQIQDPLTFRFICLQSFFSKPYFVVAVHFPCYDCNHMIYAIFKHFDIISALQKLHIMYFMTIRYNQL